MRVAANLNMMYVEVPLLQRYEKAARAGFRLVEVSVPYSERAEDLRAAADNAGLKHTLINAPPGDWTKGMRGMAALATHGNQFRDSITTAIHYANVLSVNKIHVMAGIPAACDDASVKAYNENIEYAAKSLLQENMMCLIEPINQYSIKGYFLNNYDQAKDVIDRLKLSNLKIQYDLFHAQQINGQLGATIDRLKDDIGYIQIAQVPERGEPSTTGEIDYRHVMKLLNTANSEWTVGCEYTPITADLAWVTDYGLSF